MPTPVQHLVIADAILAHPDLPVSGRSLLKVHHAAFLFGNTAPDVQTISGQTRAATHFFNVPINSDQQPHQAMFDIYAQLGRPDQLPPAHTAFMAGYIAHLLLDFIWVRDIFAPVFGPDAGWGNVPNRLFLHNVLRAWCDRNDQTRLINGTGDQLATIQSDHWLPFTDDQHLHRWRDILVEQFAPGAMIRTVEVFAARSKATPQDFERILGSQQQMDDLIFSHIPRATIDTFNHSGLLQSCALVSTYLKNVTTLTDGDSRAKEES